MVIFNSYVKLPEGISANWYPYHSISVYIHICANLDANISYHINMYQPEKISTTVQLYIYWLVVSTILKNISQWEGFFHSIPHILWKNNNMFQTTNQIYIYILIYINIYIYSPVIQWELPSDSICAAGLQRAPLSESRRVYQYLTRPVGTCKLTAGYIWYV